MTKQTQAAIEASVRKYVANGGTLSPEANRYDPKPCNCVSFLAMHDASGICVNWEQHNGKPCEHYRGLVILGKGD